MSKPVDYAVIIRDGQKQCFDDFWVDFPRQLVWGPEAFEAWLREGPEAEFEPDELSTMVIVDFDKKHLLFGESDAALEEFAIPSVHAVRQQLVENAWPGFDLSFLTERAMYKAAYDQPFDDDKIDDRPETVRQAAGFWDDDDLEEEEENDDGEEVEPDDETHRAWMTIIDENGVTRHRTISVISEDLFSYNADAIEFLLSRKAIEVPPEKVVVEGMWIDEKNRKIGFWGGFKAVRDFPRLKTGWPDWHVVWAENGYVDQCAASDLPGSPMSHTEALAKVVPALLSTERFTMGSLFGAMGGQVKKRALQAVGCLLTVMAVPILSVGYLMDRFKESVYIVIAIFVFVMVALKVIESKIKAKFAEQSQDEEEEPEPRPAAPGPLNRQERRRCIDQMLASCGFPSLAELEPHFPEKPSLNDVM
ncbi:hypothetical protein Pan258_60070 [Symmachiella dynata]|uniref:hypothetical protein n=1 Tax=Symmachiella dynata TaxID=2527995 RepID=UPI00118814AA|nr:hypothetical protein [Symmachiella dynata]QDT51910.1 hypothetical protein Pan258_60070 [Symmachiella dynata]